MARRRPERALYVTELETLELLAWDWDRLYFGHETCPWRLPTRPLLRKALAKARADKKPFTLVTPVLDDRGLKRALSLLGELGGEDELVVNDLGLLRAARAEGWDGQIALGRLLTRQRRGGGWRSELPAEPGAASYLRGCSLDSPGTARFFRSRYGVTRFEVDDLAQGVRLPSLGRDYRFSLYTPYSIMTLTSLCPWIFDGRGWGREGGCAAPCRGAHLVLEPEEGGEALLMAGCAQFLETGGGGRRVRGVDRVVFQPRLPA